MTQASKIEWTQYTWNPVTGCTKISTGCNHCYAERMARRLQAMGNKRYSNGFNVNLHDDLLKVPLKWSKPRVIFVNSMSDLFHNDVPESFIKRVYLTMNQCPQHTFQILTKRAERMFNISHKLNWSHNIWMGVTVEDTDNLWRINYLKKCGARVKFISCEPLLGMIPDLDLEGIDWVIVGGESGPEARPMREEWAISIRDQCVNSCIAYFFKQWGGFNKKRNGRVLQGRTWNETPLQRG